MNNTGIKINTSNMSEDEKHILYKLLNKKGYSKVWQCFDKTKIECKDCGGWGRYGGMSPHGYCNYKCSDCGGTGFVSKKPNWVNELNEEIDHE